MRVQCAIAIVAVNLVACGGDSPVEVTIDEPPRLLGRVAILSGSSFVPPGSNCPASNEYVRIGTLGAHEIRYTNSTTGVSGPVFDELWVCNSDDGRTMRWRSNPIDLSPGENLITVRMTASGRESQASISVRAQ